MGQATVRSGRDTWAHDTRAATEFHADKILRLDSGQKEAFVYLHNPAPMGATIASATLRFYAKGASSGARTISATRISESWKVRTLNWNNKPATTGSAATVAVDVLADGDVIEIDVTSHVQSIANGAANYGWKITTTGTATHWLYSFDAGDNHPLLEVEWSDAPDAPDDLSPSGSVVGTANPTLQFDYTDVSGSTELASVQVQIDPASSSTPAFDTGEYATTEPEVDTTLSFDRTASVTTTNLSTTVTTATATFETADVGAAITGTGIPASTTIASVTNSTTAVLSQAATASGTVTATITRTYAGLGAGNTTYWRCRVKDADGLWSSWSAWTDFTYTAKGTVTISNPAADPNDFVTESTPPIIWSFSGTQAAWQVRITRASDRSKVVYDSGKRSGTDVTIDIPKGYLKDESDYSVNVRVWDTTTDREATPGSPTFAYAWRDFTVDYDAAVTPVTALTAAQSGSTPWVELTWSRATAPDSYEVIRDNEVIKSLEPEDVIDEGGGTYSWTDYTASPQEQHTYYVVAVVNRSRSPKPTAATVTTTPTGIWLRDIDRGIQCALKGGLASTFEMLDDAETFTPVGAAESITIVSGMRGLSGQVTDAMIEDGAYGYTYEAVRDDLYTVKERPDQTVRLIVGDVNIRAHIHDVAITPHPNSQGSHRMAKVSFTFTQAGELPFDPRI